MNFKSLAVKGIKFWNKHDRTILKGVSIAGSVAAVVLAWNARPKCEDILNELNEKGASNAEKAKALAPVVGPIIAAEAISVGASVFEYKKTGEKLASLVNAVSAYKSIGDIRKEVEKETLPEEKVKEIDDKTDKKFVEKVAVSEDIEKTGHGDVIFIETQYFAKAWRANKDYMDLVLEKCNSKLRACYDKYGMLKKDDFAISFWDIYKTTGLRVSDLMDMYEFRASEHKGGLPIHFEPIEAEEKDGSTSLGYKMVIDHAPSFAYSDLVEA